MKNTRGFFLKFFGFLEVKFSTYLHRRVFVMVRQPKRLKQPRSRRGSMESTSCHSSRCNNRWNVSRTVFIVKKHNKENVCAITSSVFSMALKAGKNSERIDVVFNTYTCVSIKQI